MNRLPADDRSVLAIAWAWATRVMVVAAEMVVPGLVGYWIDLQVGSRVVFMLIGFAGGITLAIMHLVRMTSPAKELEKKNDQSRSL
jgi:hypothetical protein